MSLQIQQHVFHSPSFVKAAQVGAYYAAGTEVRTDLIIAEARKLGKPVSLPRVEGHRIAFCELDSGGELVKGRFGIMEPPPGSKVVKPDLLVVPGIGFDTRGFRLGYGKAYYDGYLASTTAFSIGLAYSFQVLDRIPKRRHDRRVNAIATEKGIVTFGV